MANILVVDDSVADRELAGHLLEEHAWTVFYAEDGKKALAQMQAHTLDLVLTDLVMPELDGLALVEQAKAEHPGVPVVLMTARGTKRSRYGPSSVALPATSLRSCWFAISSGRPRGFSMRPRSTRATNVCWDGCGKRASCWRTISI